MENKIWMGISLVALIVALGSIGYNITDETYFCDSRGIVMECARFSDSGLRCYPNLMDRVGYRDCKTGRTKIDRELSVFPVIEGNEWLCSSVECTVLELK